MIPYYTNTFSLLFLPLQGEESLDEQKYSLAPHMVMIESNLHTQRNKEEENEVRKKLGRCP